MGKLVWREAVLEFIKHSSVNCNIKEENAVLRHEICELPTKDSVPEWTPVIVSLPEESGYYLVTQINCKKKKDVRYFQKYDGDIQGGYWVGVNSKKVIAWMPLPEDYNEEDWKIMAFRRRKNSKDKEG